MPPIANILQPLIDVFESVLVFFHDNAGLSWGWSIIALTIVVRAALVPLTLKQFRSMQAMQRLAPDIKALQEKYKDDRQRLQQETMKFYQENKVNPFASCLPLLLQMPVFIALFYLLQGDLRREICPSLNPPGADAKPCGSTDVSQFFFIPDITDKATGSVLVILLVLYVGSQLISSVFMTTTADRNQRMIFIALPFIFVPFIQSFPAGLIVYWITTNLWTVGQGVIVRKMAGPVPTRTPEAAAAPAGARAAAAPEQRRRGGRERDDDGASSAAPVRASAPPPPPRKKKKRSGRRR